MTRNQVLPTGAQHELAPKENQPVVGSGGPHSEVIPIQLKRVPSGRPLRRVESFRLLRPFAEVYYRLSWTTRHTIHVVVNLYVIVYIFLTVPFRIAFYYDPYKNSREEQIARRWSEELSAFAVADGIADLMGVFQFLAFYRVWRNTFEKMKSSARSEVVKKPPTDSTTISPRNLFIRSSSFRKRRGKTKWTIATIESHSSMTDGVAESFLAQRKRLFARSVEFVFEIIAILPLELVPLAWGNFNALHLVRVTKLCRLYRLHRYLARIAKIYADRAWVQHLTSSGVDSLVRTIGVCAGLCHWVACGYMLIAHAQCGIDLTACDENVETSWVVRDRLFGASVARKYGRTLYWASRTLVLLGYDDVTPVSNAETIYAVVVTLVGALFGSSLLANFLFLFRFRNARYAAYSAHVDNAREYMRLQNIPRAVRHQVTAYYNYAWSTHHSLDSEEALELMPKHLQSKVVSTLKASRIKQVCFLTKESVEFTNMLALALVRRVYSPEDHIIEPKANAGMFFVIRGKVVIAAFDGSKPSECQEGDFFADMCLLYPEQFDQKAVAKTFCEVYVLAKAKFDEAITQFYRGSEAEVRSRMAETLEKYSMQLHKMKKLLGLRGAHESGSRKSSMGGSSHSLMAEDVHSHDSRRGASWRLPGSSFCMHWNAARLLAIIYVAFEVPYFGVFISMSGKKQIFMIQPELGIRFMLTLLVEGLFGLDLVLRSRFFAYMDPDVMFNVLQPSLIFAAYKKKGFYFDLLAWIPVGLVLDSMSIEIMQGYSTLFRLLRLLRIRWIPSLLQDLSDFYGMSSKLHLVVSLVLGVTLMLHFVGCLWFEMTFLSHEDPNIPLSSVMSNFTESQCLHEATRFQNCSWVKFDCYVHIGTVFPRENPESMYRASFAYLRSMYWAIVTLTAVGYGDIVAYSTAESYFAALWIFVGGIINFGVVGAMSSTISNVLATHHHHMEKLNTLNTVLERMAISEKLSSDIRRFYHHQFTGRKKTYESELLSHLPDQLCYEISSLLHSDSVKSVTLFDSASLEFLKEVTGKFRHRSYQNGETICFEGDSCREFFVLLQGSKINVFSRSRRVPVRALHGGDNYAVAEFLLRRSYCATLVAASRVHASVMTREQFEVIQRKFCDDVNVMKGEAETLCTLEQKRLQKIAANLEKLKLQPHSMQTPSLFYQRESAIIPNRSHSQTFLNAATIRRGFKALWTTLISFWNVYNAAFVIFRICFNSHLHFSSSINTAILIADLSCDVCFVVDIYLRLYYFCSSEPGIENLLNRKDINKHYFHSAAFKWDLVASLPMYTPFQSGSLTASLCRLPRLIRCVDLWRYLDDVIVQIQQHFATHNVSAYLSPAKLMIILGLVAHYVGCIFFLISEHECGQVETCWMAHDHLLHEYNHSVPMLYAKSFYWAITTLLLVGSRESVPRDALGTVWTGFTCLCCTFIIGHIVGEISELILELGKETKQYKSRIANFGNFAKVHDLPTSLRERVGFFFQEHFEHTKGSELQQTLDDLSVNLRLKLMLEIYGRAIANLPICRFLTSAQVNNLVLRLRPEYFIPGDNILEEGTFGNRLYTLRKGLAAAYWTKSVSSVAVLMEGAFFGEIAFFLPNQRRLATVRSTTFCEVLFVSKHDWQELWTTSGNASDNQIQKHALHAILGWVSSRLQRYQHANLRIAGRAKRLLASSSDPIADNPIAELPTSITTRNKIINGIVRTGTPPRKPSKTDLRRLFTSPEVQLLEKKAEYLLMKTEECVKTFGPEISRANYRKSSILDIVRSSLTISVRTSLRTSSRNRDGATSTNGLWHSSNADASLLVGDSKISDIRVLQFIVDLNPINKHVRDNLGEAGIRAVEEECWARCRQLAEAQHVVSKLLELLLPSESATAPQRLRARSPSGRRRVRRSWLRRKSPQSSGFEALDMAPPMRNEVKKSTEITKLAVLSEELSSARRRRLSVAASPDQRRAAASSKTELVAVLMRMTRCNSLPVIETGFFGDHARKLSGLGAKHAGVGIDFDIIQRCQRPQYVTQLVWYHRYREWRRSLRSASVSPQIKGPRLPLSILSPPKPNKRNALSLKGDIQIPGFRRLGPPRVAAMGSSLQLPSQRTLLSATTDLDSKQFIRRVKEAGKAWDLVMLMVCIYHLIVTPFKLSFAVALVEMPLNTLRRWSALEMFMDLFCVVDVVYELRHACMMEQGVISAASNTAKNRLRRIFATNPELRAYVVAMLPLELLLISDKIRVPFSHLLGLSTDATWWASRWMLRMNRMLLIRRIDHLSEQFLQFVIHDLKVSVSEALLYFVRGLSSYLATGHILACIWFGISELGFHYYGTSWLSTSGMLTYFAEGDTVLEHSGRMLSASASSSTFYLASISLARKYLRSLLFSMECISTLFYGDILSMNPLELIAEIAITLWSIYIYGALVGAQAEFLDARARREAAFEQSLGELQHYVVQNGVPKALKRQIKAYYARLWRRCRGEHEFAAVSGVSRALYEDVILTTLRTFVTQVRSFRALDEHFLRALLVCLQYVVCSENEEVFVVGDVDRSMYFIAHGRILIKTGTSEFGRERGDHFGELALLYGISRLETVVALTVSELYRLDHEPYERLLLDFPEYRTRNKLAWTTVDEADPVGSQTQSRSQTALALRPSIAKVAATTASNVDARLQYSFVYRATMKMLANMQTLHPLEAKDLILKCREAARRHLLRCAGHSEDKTSGKSGQVGKHGKLLPIFEKRRALRAQQK